MNNGLGSRLKKAFNVFFNKEQNNSTVYDYGGYYSRPDRVRLTRGNERSIINSIINKISLDVATLDIRHCRLDDEGRYKEEIKSGLNNCLSVEANMDQTARAFVQDVTMSLLDYGVVALVPVDTISTVESNTIVSNDIITMRTGKIVTWYPDSVKVRVYNDRKGVKEEVVVKKSKVAIIENPLYSVMNEPNSTLQRLIKKLIMLDSIDEQSSSGQLDLIIQLPYSIKSELRKQQANERRDEIERQLRGSKYGIAYTDGTEKITQLNRPAENNMMKQIEYLTSMLYGQLGISQSVLDGTADENTMNNYYSRTIEPIISAIVEEIDRKFISKTARTQNQKILFFRDPFKLVPVSQIAEIADKFTRNEILTSNEIRSIVGRKPSDDPKADKLINSNISQAKQDIRSSNKGNDSIIKDVNIDDKEEKNQNG